MNHTGELWQEYNDNGTVKTGKGAPKREFFQNDTMTCASAQVWIWHEVAGGGIEVLVQKRAATTSAWPNHWDISAAGHIDLGESPTEAAVREASEEIGVDIDPDKLFYVAMKRVFPPNDLSDMLEHIFLYQLDSDEHFNFNDGEVADIKWVSLANLKKWLAEKNPTEEIVQRGDDYFAQLFRHLERLSARKNS